MRASSYTVLTAVSYLLYRFRWVFCQLDTLQHCFPPNIRQFLNELPETLDETYERILKGINRAQKAHAHRLLQCLTVAVRPLRVEELTEHGHVAMFHGFIFDWSRRIRSWHRRAWEHCSGWTITLATMVPKGFLSSNTLLNTGWTMRDSRKCHHAYKMEPTIYLTPPSHIS